MITFSVILAGVLLTWVLWFWAILLYVAEGLYPGEALDIASITVSAGLALIVSFVWPVTLPIILLMGSIYIFGKKTQASIEKYINEKVEKVRTRTQNM